VALLLKRCAYGILRFGGIAVTDASMRVPHTRGHAPANIPAAGAAPQDGRWRAARFGVLVAALIGLVATHPRPYAQTTDGIPPTVVAVTPSANSTGVAPQTSIAVVFSEPVAPATVVLELRNGANQLVPGVLSYDAATLTATFDPDAALLGSQTHTALVRGARDAAGNQMTQVSWSFTTATAGFFDEVLPQTGLVDPMVVAFAADGRMFVAEKSGRIQVFDDETDSSGTVVADLRLNVYNFWDRGMLGMALHPDFPTTPYIYVLYTYDAVPGGTAPRWGSASNPQVGDPCPTPPGANQNGCVVTGRLSRLDIGAPGLWPLSHLDEQPLITDWFQQFPSHSIGALVFGPDRALYVSGGEGASFSYADIGQTSSSPSVNAGGVINDPPGEGGALRSQDLQTSGDPVTLDGAVIRIDPDTGLALPDNPGYATQSDPNGRRIVAYGFRNPLRMTFRPGTRELWVGDVGWGSHEEINRIVDPIDSTVDNMGWPCYEGAGLQPGYDSTAICAALTAQGPAAVVAPYFSYAHQQVINAGEPCGTGSSSTSGLHFYGGSDYPAAYQGALFFADYSRKCIWAMRAGANGLPDTNTIENIVVAAGPVALSAAPGGDVIYPGFDDDRLHRIRYAGGNLPPVAAISATPASGPSPLAVSFSAAASTDPEGQALTFQWDLDGDGAFDDGSGATAAFVYTQIAATVVTARVLVSDPGGQSAVAATTVLVNGTGPTAVIDTPGATLQWKVGDPVVFSGRGLDADEPGGELPASALRWEVVIYHCPSDCHVHVMQSFDGVAGGSFAAPDHEYPSFLELRLTVTDPTGATSQAAVALQPQTTTLSVATIPLAPLDVVLNGQAATAPFSRTVIVGSSNSLNALSPQVIGANVYDFASWSDGQPRVHNVIVPATPTTYTATYTASVAPAQTVTVAVAASADDANQTGGSIDTSAPTVWLGNAAPTAVNTLGLRFANVPIPPGATVTAANLEVNASSTQWTSMSFEVGAEAAANPAAFSESSGPSSRPLLPPRVQHFTNEQWIGDTWYAIEPDITTIVQAALDQPGWASGNALALILRGTEVGWARKHAHAFDGDPTRAPRLVVTYSVPPSGPLLAVGDAAIVEGNDGTTQLTFPVTLSLAPGATPITVNYATIDGSATAGQDYTATSGTLSFVGTTVLQTISVPIAGDALVEANETFTVMLSTPVGATLSDATATGTITNDDQPPPTLAVADTSVTEGNAGTTTAVFTVTLSAAPGATPVTVDFATGNLTATAGQDYTATSGTLTFSGTTVVRTIAVPVIGDTTVEPTETFTVTLSNPTGATIGAATATGSIVSDDTPPTVSIADASVVEGNSGSATAQFAVTLSAPPGAAVVTVEYATANGTAIAPADFTAAAGTLTFTGTTTTQMVSVTIIGDTLPELNESFGVALANPSNATIADGSAVGTIVTDDAPPPTEEFTKTFQISAGADDTYEEGTAFTPSDTSLWLGSSGTASNAVTGLRFPGVSIPAGAAIVSARLEVTAAATQWSNLEFEAAAEAAASSAAFSAASRPSQRSLLAPRVSHQSNVSWTTNTWYAVADVAPLLQAVIDQPTWNSGQAMALVLRGGSPWARKPIRSFEGSATRAPRLIVTYRAVTSLPAMAIADTSIAEGNSGTTAALVTVTLSSPPGATPITVNYATSNGTAVAPGDYTATSGSLSFTGTTVSQTISVPILGDTTVEPDEAFTVTLSGPVGATLADGSATGTLTNDDAAPLPTLSIADVTQAEGNAPGTALFTVTLSAPPGATPVTVNYATSDGTALAGQDYTTASGTLSFSGTTVTQTISVPILGDTTVEPDEAFTVTLSGPVGATLADGSATGTLTNDDAAPLPTLSIADVSVTEPTSNTAVTFTVTLSAPSAQTVSVAWATANLTATAGQDYTAASGTLTFTPGVVTRTLSVTIRSDSRDELLEQFAVNLSAPVNATIADGQAIGSIVDDDPTPTLTINDVSVNEGNNGTRNVTFSVTLSAASNLSVSVNYQTADGTATATDYVATSGTLVFDPGTTRRTFTVAVRGDTIDEPNETFFAVLSNAVNAELARVQGMATIVDND
jgi:glucose/arabinose dehydrogenase